MNTAQRETPGTFERVLVPVDFSAGSHRAVEVAIALRRAFGACVRCFNLAQSGENDEFLGGLGSPDSPGRLVERERAALRRFIDHVAPGESEGVECEARLGEDPVAAIREEANRWGATIVLLSPATHGGLLRSHTEKLVQQLDVPVIVLPPSGAE